MVQPIFVVNKWRRQREAGRWKNWLEDGQDRRGSGKTFPARWPVQIAFLNSITMPVALMTPVITAAMSKLIKVVGSLSLTFMPSPFQRSFLRKRVETSRQLPVSRNKERRGEERRGKKRRREGKKQSFRPSDSIWTGFPFKTLYVPPRSRFMAEWRKLRSRGFLKVKFLPRGSRWMVEAKTMEYFFWTFVEWSFLTKSKSGNGVCKR